MPVVVLFKSESEGPDKFVQLLQQNDFNVHSINCLSFQFKSLEKLQEKIGKADDFEGMIFTSLRSVQAVHKAVESEPELLERWQQKSNFSVGESTSESSKNLLKLETKGQSTGNAQVLASFIVDSYSEKPTKPFLFPSGNLKQETLEESLKENSIEVENVEIYETVQHPELEKSIKRLKGTKVEFFVFFSPSGIKFSLPIVEKLQVNLAEIKLIAIGPSTKKSLEDNKLECHRMCTKPSPESLLEALNA
jgi:uroporphyrinogen-III synthase